MTPFEPDYRHVVAAAVNKKPARLPIYEHQINLEFISIFLEEELSLDSTNPADLQYTYSRICEFWKKMTYDTVSFEAGICDILPDGGAILGGKKGPIQNRDDFNKYPFDELPDIFWKYWTPRIEAIASVMPKGMKALGGCGNGVFEISEDLVGYEHLCVLMFDDPQLFADLYVKIGDLMTTLWTQMMERYRDLFAVGRMGDDLGFKSATLLAPDTIVQHVIPQYKRIINIVHNADKPFLLHSCGNIFPVMDAAIDAGINAKHSNEDIIAPFTKWIELYSDRIGLFGGIDVNLLCLESPDTIHKQVVEQGTLWRRMANGFAIGSGNSIPEFVPVDGYMAMVEGVKEIRWLES